MTRSELVEALIACNPEMTAKEVDLAIKQLLETISHTLEQGHRIEVRGFGSFSLHYHQPRAGRNPRTGESVALSAKSVPHFRAGKALKALVDGE